MEYLQDVHTSMRNDFKKAIKHIVKLKSRVTTLETAVANLQSKENYRLPPTTSESFSINSPSLYYREFSN